MSISIDRTCQQRSCGDGSGSVELHDGHTRTKSRSDRSRELKDKKSLSRREEERRQWVLLPELVWDRKEENLKLVKWEAEGVNKVLGGGKIDRWPLRNPGRRQGSMASVLAELLPVRKAWKEHQKCRGTRRIRKERATCHLRRIPSFILIWIGKVLDLCYSSASIYQDPQRAFSSSSLRTPLRHRFIYLLQLLFFLETSIRGEPFPANN